MVIVVPFVVLILLMVFGLPIAFSLGLAGILGIWVVTGDLSVVMGVVSTSPYRSSADYLMTTIPMFILMAYMISASGIARDLYTAAANWFSPIRGGLAMASVFSSGVFGAMSGSSSAAAAVISSMAIPNMRRLGYSDVLSAGAVGVGATLVLLIPPSIGMVIYGLATETSIGALLIAGILPGILAGVLLILVIWIWVTLRPSLSPGREYVPWSVRISSLKGVWPSLVIIVVVILLLYAGVATPSELGAMGALAAILVAIGMRRLTWSAAMEATRATVRSSAMIFAIIIGAKLFAYFMTLSQVPQNLVTVVTAMELNRWVVILAICVGYFVLSMFMDEIPLMLLTLQLTFPLVRSLGFDPVWFGVVCMLLASLGLIFPPVGMVAFVVSSSARVELMQVYKGTSVLMVALILTLALVMIFPDIALLLPRLMR